MCFPADYKHACVRPSANFGERRGDKNITMLILHYTGMESLEAAEERLKDGQAEVSSHYLVAENGQVIQLVAENKRAWHAGRSFWAGENDINSCSIGIEIQNAADLANWPPYPEQQIASVIALSKDILMRHPLIGADNVLGHSDIAPERKIDPGALFPWQKLAQHKIGLYVPPVALKNKSSLQNIKQEGKRILHYQHMLQTYGYHIALTGQNDMQTQLVTKAFQRHFRPEIVDGIIDNSTFATLQNLLAAKELAAYFS